MPPKSSKVLPPPPAVQRLPVRNNVIEVINGKENVQGKVQRRPTNGSTVMLTILDPEEQKDASLDLDKCHWRFVQQDGNLVSGWVEPGQTSKLQTGSAKPRKSRAKTPNAEGMLTRSRSRSKSRGPGRGTTSTTSSAKAAKKEGTKTRSATKN